MAEAPGIRRRPAHLAWAATADAAPRNRDRLVELAMAVCIIGVLSALYILHAQRLIILSYLSDAYTAKEENQVTFLTSLALEGKPRGGNHGGVVGLAPLRHGVTGLKFLPDSHTTFVINWRCTTASKAEIEQELATGKGQATKNLRDEGAQAVALPASDAPGICQGVNRDAQ